MENKIEVNGKEYVLKSTVRTHAKPNVKGMTYCIVRTYSAGVFAGWFNRKTIGKEGTVFEATRLWYWEGANSLSDLATKGSTTPDKCKFCVPVEVDLKEIIEVIPCTESSKKFITELKKWEK